MATRTVSAALAMTLSFMFLPATSSGQSGTTGAIAGTLTDTTGAVLPGVTVEASSPALIERVRVVVSDGSGEYKVVDLRPGTYTVTFTLPGFSVVQRENIVLTTGFTAAVNAEMTVGEVTETVVVTGVSPIVDVQNVRSMNVLSREVLDSVPNSKTVQSFADLTLGASITDSGPVTKDVAGNTGERAAAIVIHGSRGKDSKLNIDGMNYNYLGGSGGGNQRTFRINQIGVQEVALQTSGVGAESETGGVQVNYVPREGANMFTLYSLANFTNGSMQNRNLSDDLRARGLSDETSIHKIYDAGVGIGGAIIEDRVWFYSANRWWGADEFPPGSFFNATQGTPFYTPDRDRPAHTETWNLDHGVRITWQATDSQKVTVATNYQSTCNCLIGLSGTTAPEATGAFTFKPQVVTQGTWTYPVTNRFLLAGGMSYVYGVHHFRPQPGVTPQTIAIRDSGLGIRYRARGSYQENVRSINTNGRFSVSYVTGSHAFKTGVQLMHGLFENPRRTHESVTYTFTNQVPTRVTQWAHPIDVTTKLNNIALYVQDQWTMENVTLNLGVRFNYFNAYAPAIQLPAARFIPARNTTTLNDVPNWTDIDPRLGVAYDLFGDGKTAIKANVSRYVEGEAMQFALRNAPALTIVQSTNRTWGDTDGDFEPDCDLTDFAINGECGAIDNNQFGLTRPSTRFAPEVLDGFASRPYGWQGLIGLQHELRPGLAVDIGYFRTWYGNHTLTDNELVTPADFTSYCITAPVEARLPGGGGNELCGLADINPAKFGQVNNLIRFSSDFGKQTEVFNGVDVGFDARLGNGGVLGGGLSVGRTVNDTCDVVPDSPEAARPGFCDATPPWSAGTQVKFQGLYPLPWWGLEASGSVQNLPGIPVSANYTATNAEILPSLDRDLAKGAGGTVTIPLIAPRTQFEDRLTQADIRVTKVFPLGRGRFRAQFDVYNLFNASTVLRVNNSFGANWLVPSVILAPRIFKLGGQFDF